MVMVVVVRMVVVGVVLLVINLILHGPIRIS
jgi:hypothetical protein